MIMTDEHNRDGVFLNRLLLILIGLAGIGNLTVLQIHIQIITKVFASDVGFYFFLYIIFGLVTFMSAMNMRKKPGVLFKLIFSIFACLVTFVGYLYLGILLEDIKSSTILTYQDVAPVVYVIAGSMVIYGLGGLVMLIGTVRKDR